MFDNFRYLPSNPHYICWKDTPTKGLVWPLPIWWPWLPCMVTSASQRWVLFFNLQYLGQSLSYCIHTWHDGRRMHDLDLDLDFERHVLLVFSLHCGTYRCVMGHVIGRLTGRCQNQSENWGEAICRQVPFRVRCVTASCLGGSLPRSNAWRKASVSRTID